MKTIIIVRHAKSSWDDHTITDFDRPLNDRGKHDAPIMAERLLKKYPRIEAFISSPAKRALKTAAIFAKAYGLEKEEVQLGTPSTTQLKMCFTMSSANCPKQ